MYTDHLAIVLGLRRGRAWCCCGKRAHADVWRQIWFCVEDREFPVENVRHCKAHRSRAAMDALDGQERQAALGNHEVDRLAKAAAEMDAGFGRELAIQEASDRATWALHNIGWWHERVDVWDDMQEKPAEPPPRKAESRAARPLDLVQHDLVSTKDGVRCKACGRQACTFEARRRLFNSKCVPKPWTRIGPPADDPRAVTVLGRRVGWIGPPVEAASGDGAVGATSARLDGESKVAYLLRAATSGSSESRDTHGAAPRGAAGDSDSAPPTRGPLSWAQAEFQKLGPSGDHGPMDSDDEPAAASPAQTPATSAEGVSPAAAATAAAAAGREAPGAQPTDAGVRPCAEERAASAMTSAGAPHARRPRQPPEPVNLPPQVLQGEGVRAPMNGLEADGEAMAGPGPGPAGPAPAAPAAAEGAAARVPPVPMPPAQARPQARAGAASVEERLHRVRECYGYVFCVACGAYACRRTIGLSKACPGWPEQPSRADRKRQQAVERIQAGLHPKTKRPLE